MELSQHTVNYLVELAEASSEQEVCGLILRNQTVHPILNIARDPEHRFEMDPVQQLEALEAFSKERLGDQIMGIYHSHPNGRQSPTDTDLAGWPPDGWSYYVVSRSVVLEWERSGDELTLIWAKQAGSEKELAGTAPQSTANGRPGGI